MKLYYYAPMSNALEIFKSGGIYAQNPSNFIDPNDCVFKQDEEDKKKTEKLIQDYFLYVALEKMLEQNKIQLNGDRKSKLDFLRKEMETYKSLLKKRPYFDGIPGFDNLLSIIGSKIKEAKTLVQKGKKGFQKTVDKAIEDAKANALISCYSKNNSSILMWSHYAKAHTGACIEYEKPNDIDFRNIKYQRKRPTMKMYKAISHAIALHILGKIETDAEIAKALKDTLDPFFIKSIEWKYEEEIRCLFHVNKLDKHVKHSEDKYITDLGLPSALYIGCKAADDENLHSVIQFAKDNHIPVYNMKTSEDYFEIVVDKRIY